MVSRPSISVVTPCLNRVQFIEEAIQSVIQQNSPTIEHIVIDGCSSDGTLDVLQRYPHLRVVSEPDQGVYEAINKGIRLSQGKIIGLLNSDDLYEKNVFAAIQKIFDDDSTLDAVAGGASVFSEDGTGTRQTVACYVEPSDVKLSLRNVTVGVPITNARFFRRDVFERIGVFDTQYAIAADR